ncbi:ras-related Ral-a [Brachionus plicatilis]|uniref:Ras-related Ral-a n=1 Tax=Brachionus plicatilis TaxID=10195 RepID=A0A3M7RI63_BRAPC|nr:ras-related Ral-a [Brachionus plicatilis]
MTAQMASFLKLTLVGDGGVGKSCLILQYMYHDFVEEYEPTKADAYRRTITLQGEDVQIDILDTAGQEDYPAVRDGYLKHGDGFLLVFDLTNRETFESIRNHRENVLRVKADDANLPIILIGNKSDLRQNRLISFEEANSLATQWNIPYIETSAKTRENVDRAFSEIFLKIKEIKQIRRQNPQQYQVPASSVMTPEEEKAVREDSLRKRIKKFYQNFKKKCKIS